MPAGIGLSRDGRLLFAGRALRTFGFGYLSIILTLFLRDQGLSTQAIGMVLTATLIEDALATTFLAAVADRFGRRRILILTPFLITLAGAVLAVAMNPWLLMIAAVIGTLSPGGQEAGPFAPLEQAALPNAVRPEVRTRAFAWYNIFGFLPAALGALAAGAWMAAAQWLGADKMTAYRILLGIYGASGLLLSLLYSRLSPGIESEKKPAPAAGAPARTGFMGLHRSRGVVFQLAGLQAVDALAGGFIIQSILVLWFRQRYGVEAEVLGPIFFGTNLLSAVSFLIAARVAERFGLLNTMVFTHLPSNLLLMLVPLMPTLPLAATVLFLRHVLSQMDVPTRQAYAMVLVDPDERSAAAGFITSARAMAQAVAPSLTGRILSAASVTGLPFFLAGGMKSAYDLALYFRFRNVPLPEEPKGAGEKVAARR
ncbi:MAG: MFS transporter [Armatimonadetes bacterium]|nr:MFS transporter [Armatimonadota bacterium]